MAATKATTSKSLSLPSMVETLQSVYTQVTEASGRVMAAVSREPRGTVSVSLL